MSKTSYIKDTSGEVVGIRDTSDDGRESTTYERSGTTIFGQPMRGAVVDITDNNADGTSESYKVSSGMFGQPIRDRRK